MATTILAVESSSELRSAALLINNECISCSASNSQQGECSLLQMVSQLLAQASIPLASVDLLSFGHGPGSFTGIRIATAIAQGLSLGIDKPLVGISTLHALAQRVYRVYSKSNIIVAIDACMSQFYWASYCRQAQDWYCHYPESLVNWVQVPLLLEQHIGEWILAGSGWSIYPYNLSKKQLHEKKMKKNILLHAEDLIPLALSSWQQGKVFSAAQAQPCYLRDQKALKYRQLK